MIKYRSPFKLGFRDKSGRAEFWIVDQDDKPIVHGQGEYNEGGIQSKGDAYIIIKALNLYYELYYEGKNGGA